MCINAETSFSVALVAAAIGIAAVRSVREPRDWVLATLPLAFAVHQAAEGVTWLLLNSAARGTCTGPSVSVWTLFAYALVPLWLGGGVTLVEADRRRRRIMAAMLAAGAVALPWLLNTALAGSVHARAADAHVQYLTEPMAGWVMVAYGLALLGPPLLSTGPWLRLCGILGMASWLAARAISLPGLPSLWCMAAAALSVLVLLHLRSAQRGPAPARRASRVDSCQQEGDRVLPAGRG
jgi:Family of unknown function (DUF6629)